jgi:hypothetical protein
MQAPSDRGLLRGAQAIADYLNSRMIGGKPVSRSAVYRMIEGGKIAVTRMGEKRSEMWSTRAEVDRSLGLAEPICAPATGMD